MVLRVNRIVGAIIAKCDVQGYTAGVIGSQEPCCQRVAVCQWRSSFQILQAAVIPDHSDFEGVVTQNV